MQKVRIQEGEIYWVSISKGRKPIEKRCSNCGRLFSYTGSHATRNKYFFCCYECYIAFKTKQVEVEYDWCGNRFLKKESAIRRTDHNFCSLACSLAYRHKAGEGPWNHRIDGAIVHRKAAEDKLGRRLYSWEEVHHIDGNHFNNDPENIEVLSKSEHSKIHASWKERNSNGQFIKQNTAP